MADLDRFSSLSMLLTANSTVANSKQIMQVSGYGSVV